MDLSQLSLSELLEALDVFEEGLLGEAVEGTRASDLLELLQDKAGIGGWAVNLKIENLERIVRRNHAISDAVSKSGGRAADQVEGVESEHVQQQEVKFTLADNIRDLAAEFGNEASISLKQLAGFQLLKKQILAALPKTAGQASDLDRKFGLGEG